MTKDARGIPLIQFFIVGFAASAVATLLVCEIAPTAPLPAWLINCFLRAESATGQDQTGVRDMVVLPS